ncbi:MULTISPECIES: FtsH protease activity modulator HflK [unclassified Gilliamella]|uniref:FtsH protease activity modulator HflK n=1 Tax=unclassified Gilliamella TaxID=2685620 RepID=UPI002269B8EA|nr:MULTISPECIES: FtsH protease activity modulator HflK [unclassified Gilliamella]MCX8597374.1 FtsH protease activity modulator HflK [Gilliamella sp. B3493]MCX8599843.1 FtsH protease activity modulator HflK [Gilliamella sp. B3486]MCX8671356.1 FtsH protease activity modulator HflK [Gilliamella sp. B2785]MCX8678931.1 FtsH protease activity modulator HflK [Gilliamella sp. B2865]MCX8690118.1 FtsH protease activity modulator HflK [Gilliamella sp. B2973]
MAWNQPGNNGQDNDPWGNNKKPSNSSSGGIFDQIKDLLKRGGSSNNRGSSDINLSSSKIIMSMILVLALIWGVSGFYTINQNQRGVITRFGQVQPEIIQPGLNWNPAFIDTVYKVDTQGTYNFNVQGDIITTSYNGENLVFVEMNVQYRISDPIKYLFNVTNVEDSLRQAADSALRTSIGSSNIDAIISDGRSVLENSTKEELINVISHYDMGITIVDLNFQVARPPVEVQDAYADAIRAQNDSEREIKKAEAYKVQLIQQAEGRSATILEDANAYKVQVELEAAGDVARFEKLLPQYKAAPEITKDRLYIETMEKVLTKTQKVIVNDKSGNLLVLPLEKLVKNKIEPESANLSNLSSDGNNNPPAASETVDSTSQNNNEAQNATTDNTTTNNTATQNNSSINRSNRAMGR